MLSIKQYPKETKSTSLDALLSLDCAFISTHSFAPVNRDVALDLIDKKRDKLINAEDKGESQIDALQDLEDSIASGESTLGNHHHTLMLLAPTLPALEKSINKAVQAYAAVDHVVVVKETPIGQEPAFWAQIPGNHAFIARSSPITSHNFVDFCPMHNLQTGFKDGNALGSAVTLLETPAKTPVYFNYHGKGTRTNPSNGHTLVLGSSDAGKTTLVSFLDAQMGRYGGRSFFIDRDGASKIYILASGNSRYMSIKPDNAHRCAMNPLQLPDTPKNRSFLKIWLGELIKKPNEMDIPANIAGMINECINYSFEQLDKPYRTLSYVTKILPMDFPRWPELRVWLKGNGVDGDGAYSWLFDNENDALELGFDKVGFDVTYLMDEVSALISTPVYLYMVHQMHQCLDGRLTSIIIDEAFQVFKTPFWVALLENDLPTIRKANGHFVFMTQSPETILNSPIAATLFNNTKTKIILPNPMANKAVYVDALQLTESEYQTVLKTPVTSRLFLFKQDNESILCKADLRELGDEVRVLSGNKESVALLDSLLEKSEDVDLWLPEFLKRSAPHEKK
jgi:type IV secretion system protein VirB4